MKITESKVNKGYSVISNATPEAIEYLNDTSAKFQSNGLVVVRTFIIEKFNVQLEKAVSGSHIFPEVEDFETMYKEADKIASGYVANDIGLNWKMKDWNRVIAGRTVAEIDEMVGDTKDQHAGGWLISQ